ncbi:STAS domain-containing protein [Streptomyces sp. RPA4-2]|uniref:STAS domain-containing protein n=1 Tax=Streptomyces sp. RPA4-2 TaxID=2721244 RepID=UPI00143E8ED2|nr:STAS domain-containing protein [Streptomyces sp. RPA4-2]QIY63845.1 STAS domain-containing protein [Streptomyces sp. RPA4-2]
MHLPPLTVRRHDDKNRALITLAGEIDLETVPLVRASLEQCLRDGIHTVDVDLTSLTFCDCSALNAFLHASQRLTTAGGTLRLHHPPSALVLMVDIAGCAFLLLGLPFGQLPIPPGNAPTARSLVPPRGPVPPPRVLLSGAV